MDNRLIRLSRSALVALATSKLTKKDLINLITKRSQIGGVPITDALVGEVALSLAKKGWFFSGDELREKLSSLNELFGNPDSPAADFPKLLSDEILASQMNEGERNVITTVAALSDGSCFFYALGHAARDIGKYEKLLNCFKYTDGTMCTIFSDKEFVTCCRNWMSNVISHDGPANAIIREIFDAKWVLYCDNKPTFNATIRELGRSVVNAWNGVTLDCTRQNDVTYKNEQFNSFLRKFQNELRNHSNSIGEIEIKVMENALIGSVFNLRVVYDLKDCYQGSPNELVLLNMNNNHYVSLKNNVRFQGGKRKSRQNKTN